MNNEAFLNLYKEMLYKLLNRHLLFIRSNNERVIKGERRKSMAVGIYIYAKAINPILRWLARLVPEDKD